MNHTITTVYVFGNGMTMVFDERGQQMPDYQGRWEDVKDTILRDKPAEVCIYTNHPWRPQVQETL